MRVRAGAHGTTLGPGTGQSRHRPRPEPSPLPIPDIDLVRRIGRGGFGEAWLGVNRATGGLKAVKIVPLAHGGSDEDSNIRCLCAECHAKRTAEQFGKRRTVAVGPGGWPIG